MQHNHFEGSVVPFARRWHVIQEVDLVRLLSANGRRAALCNRLEDLADSLPELPGEEQVAALCPELQEAIVRDARDELSYLDAMLRRQGDPLADVLLEHVRMRRSADVAGVQELVAALQPKEGETRLAPDALGYLLRGFFSDCRRAIDYEQLAILALAGHRLTPEAREMLIDAIAERAVG
ncbi:hypothetical protein [Sphingomonas aracearum]|uniref:Uncharacterized protein n=1 Tax=Sphingomonas aracearum TaxID=2283317 RepID=A0A369VV75_9SPHN|nr:hypothetical protein [Sphingomonas aracearum]RDE04972.1 hypothetical protein DVW87_15555 [Sphingomonas aracearum]